METVVSEDTDRLRGEPTDDSQMKDAHWDVVVVRW